MKKHNKLTAPFLPFGQSKKARYWSVGDTILVLKILRTAFIPREFGNFGSNFSIHKTV